MLGTDWHLVIRSHCLAFLRGAALSGGFPPGLIHQTWETACFYVSPVISPARPQTTSALSSCVVTSTLAFVRICQCLETHVKSRGVCTEVPNVDTKRRVREIGVFLVREVEKNFRSSLSWPQVSHVLRHRIKIRGKAGNWCLLLTPGSWWRDL